ncbi:MAG: 3-hydroxyacyl-ACP dehydratase FabZ [Candidatus Calescibacterium sp.]|nr:3-hydroxyacyl-ACP dehydratase FabZ [Candidatus Calescibacterium sp.]MDW8132438.1 3-hydroxyacyl-ACP dehydratase FabZ [Candidatus Calescibacterium sp.]
MVEEIILKSLPHRYPFLFVDKVISITDDEIVAQKNVSMNEWFFSGHFPNKPVFPGVIIIEAVAQAAGVLFLSSFQEKDKYLALLIGVENFKFKKIIKPGDILTIRVKKIKIRKMGDNYFPTAQSWVFVGDELVAEGNLNFALKKEETVAK